MDAGNEAFQTITQMSKNDEPVGRRADNRSCIICTSTFHGGRTSCEAWMPVTKPYRLLPKWIRTTSLRDVGI